MTESELIHLVKSGDSRGFQKLIDYYPVIKKSLGRYGLNERDIEDIFQDSMVVLYEKIREEDFELTSNIYTYLHSIAKYKGLAFLRKEKRQIDDNDVDLIREMDDLVFGSYDFSWEEESPLPSQEIIERAIDDLGSPCREILYEFYYHKSNIDEIKDNHGYASINSARVAKSKCLRRLRDKLNLDKF
ncbi:MAG: sigma-70 family RNA polymerase sigma factor [Bacteroidota bacterium]